MVPWKLDLYLENWCSDFSYLTCFMNYEVNHIKKGEFDKVNLII